ncbi:MAG TPA: kynureninase [Saprospiraceae bacterium]|jgi:kynureninase|nr:kynureninase [Saprospiraceae bacterium]
MKNSSDYFQQLDQEDVLHQYRDMFFIPKNKNNNDLIYYCGNSLGLLSKQANAAVKQELDDWATYGVEGHLEAKYPWVKYHEFLCEPMAEIVGAKPKEVVMMNGLTTNLHLMMISFYRPTKTRHKILIEFSAFPSDRYAVESQIKFHGYDPNESLIILKPSSKNGYITIEQIQEILKTEGEEIALVLIGSVNYYTGQAYPISQITKLAKSYGANVGFDLAHGAGNLDLKLHEDGPDFAVWCGYKYLNGGPGCIAGCFVHERHHDDHNLPRLSGWWGHDKVNRFKMGSKFEMMIGAEGWQLSNPPILAMAALRESLLLFQKAGINNLRTKSIRMHNLLANLLREWAHPNINIITPEKDDEKGCQLSIQLKQPDKKIFNSLIENNIIGDWREPDVIRIAPVPLYNCYSELFIFYNSLKRIIENHG